MEQNDNQGLAKRHMFPWLPIELESVISEFQSGRTIPCVAVNHRRSVSSIESKLMQAGLIDNPHANQYRN